MGQPSAAQQMEQVIRAYIQACNHANADAIAACFSPEAVHYFPFRAKWSGAAAIGSNFAKLVREGGYRWTIDQLLVDVERGGAALEWTILSRQPGWLGRGVDWLVFEPRTLRLREVRPYYAAPFRPDVAHQEQLGFDYPGRGYPT